MRSFFSSSHPISTLSKTVFPRDDQPTHQLFRADEQENSNQSLCSGTDWLPDLSSKTLLSQVGAAGEQAGLGMLLLRLAEVHMPSAGDVLIHPRHEHLVESNSIPFIYQNKPLSRFLCPTNKHPSSFLCLGLIFLSRVDCNRSQTESPVGRLYSVNKMHRSSVVCQGLTGFFAHQLCLG